MPVRRSSPGSPVEQRLDILPGVLDVLVVVLVPIQIYMLAPGVDVWRVRRVAVGCVWLPVRVEDEFVRRVEFAAIEALNALGPGANVASGYKSDPYSRN